MIPSLVRLREGMKERVPQSLYPTLLAPPFVPAVGLFHGLPASPTPPSHSHSELRETAYRLRGPGVLMGRLIGLA